MPVVTVLEAPQPVANGRVYALGATGNLVCQTTYLIPSDPALFRGILHEVIFWSYYPRLPQPLPTPSPAAFLPNLETVQIGVS